MASTEQQLVELPGLYAQLEDLLTTRTPGQAEKVRSSGSAPASQAPVRVEVLDARRNIADALEQWVNLIGVGSREGVLSQCWYLRWALPDTPHAEGLAAAVDGMYALARNLLGERPFMWPRHDACGGKVVEFRCDLCLHTWGDKDIIKRLADLGRTATLRQATQQTGVQLKTLEYWVREGLLEPVSERRPKLYKLSQVEWLRDKSRRKTTRRAKAAVK